ncbi:MAG: cellulase family glycosylhydrolase [Polyangiaceae bacterium]|nr:cellulase family glycosylhydrolase [Polyangiaceae bacterium]
MLLRRCLPFGLAAAALSCALSNAGGPEHESERGLGGASGGNGPPQDAGAEVGPGWSGTDAGAPSGWLFTRGNKVYVAGASGPAAVWVGRGFNIDDMFFCGYNAGLTMPNAEQAMMTLVDTAITTWKPTFLRFSLSMSSYARTSWTGDAAQYKTPMTNVVREVGKFPGVYALVTLRSDVSMTCADDATCLPTPATDAVYVALVDSFARAPFVAFGVANEPGGNAVPSATLADKMMHVVSVVRAEEDRLGVPHHIVSVQGTNWTSDI